VRVDPKGALVGLFGLIVCHIAFTSTSLLYVKGSMRPWLALAGCVLIIISIARVWRASRARDLDLEPADSIRGASWLLVVPLVLVLVVLPSPLGSFSASRQAANQLSAFSFDPLPPPHDGASDVNIASFIGLIHREPASLKARPLRILGFVSRADSGQSFLLTRFWMTCCAADAVPVQVRIDGVRAPSRDSWVEVVGIWRSPSGRTGKPQDVPIVDASSVTPVGRPQDPYAN
jgi:uncharacterized repeat protein (TIGR03943 family)